MAVCHILTKHWSAAQRRQRCWHIWMPKLSYSNEQRANDIHNDSNAWHRKCRGDPLWSPALHRIDRIAGDHEDRPYIGVDH